MNLDRVFVCDIETVGMLEDIKSFDDLHVFSCCYQDSEGLWQIKSTNKFEDIQKVVGNPNNTVLFHNGISYDKPVLEKMGVNFKAEVIDSLGLSWYLEPKRLKHGLESYGEDYGVPKPVIDNWQGLSFEEYKHRCEEDVKINTNLWVSQLKKLRTLYDNDDEHVMKVVKYLMFKLKCLHLQEMNPLTIDVEACKQNLELLEGVIEEKIEVLKQILPPVPVKVTKKCPKNWFKKDGSLTKAALDWVDILEKVRLNPDYKGDIEVVKEYKEPNPTSSVQMKNYLFSLGWEPKIFKDGANGKVPQLRDDDKKLCKSIKNLIELHPQLEALDGLSVAQHRAGILKGFLEEERGGKVVASASKLARSLRLAHRKPCVNLPKPSAQYGELIRSVIIAPEGYVLCGSDVSSLENKTLQNAIYHLDKDYVEEMNFPGFDAHLKLGKMAGLISEEDSEFFSWFKKFDKVERDNDVEEMQKLIDIGKENPTISKFMELSSEDMHLKFNSISKSRSVSKTANYALTYNCQPPTLAESAKIPLKEAKKIHEAYWDMNWAVKKYTDSLTTKKLGREEWIYNPASNMWLYLSSNHIKFSACNQNAGVKIFDTWVYFAMEMGIIPSFQAHDEILFACKPEEKEDVERKLRKAMEKVNKVFNLPIPIEIDVQFGNNYAEVH